MVPRPVPSYLSLHHLVGGTKAKSCLVSRFVLACHGEFVGNLGGKSHSRLSYNRPVASFRRVLITGDSLGPPTPPGNSDAAHPWSKLWPSLR